MDETQSSEQQAIEDIKANRTASAAQLNILNYANENPDTFAHMLKVSRDVGLPVETVLGMPDDAERQHKTQSIDWGNLAKTAPGTAKLLANATAARVSHDDIPGFQAIERTFLEDFTMPVQRGWEQGKQNIAMTTRALGLFDGWDRQRQQVADAMGIDASPLLDSAVQMANQNRNIQRYFTPDDIEQTLQEGSQAKSMGEVAAAYAKNPKAILETALQSVGTTGPAIAAAAGGSVFGPGGTTAGMFAGSSSTEYASTVNDFLTEHGMDSTDPMSIMKALNNPYLLKKAKEKGVTRGLIVGAVDALTAGQAGRFLAAAKTPLQTAGALAKEAGMQAMGGATGENMAQVATGEYNPNDIAMEAAAEIPSGFVEAPMNYAEQVKKIEDRAKVIDLIQEAKAQQADGAAQKLDQLDQLVKASKVLKRDPETFQQFIEAATEDGPTENVYIDAKALYQSGMADMAMQASPAIQQQLPRALETYGTIQIPTSEFMTVIGPTDMFGKLVDHIKFDPEGFTRAEAQQHIEQHAEEMQQEVARAIEQAQQDQAFEVNTATVQQQIKDMLDKTGYNTKVYYKGAPENANEHYATMLGHWYGVTAAKLGITPDELYQRYPLQFGGGNGLALNQTAALSDIKSSWDKAGIDAAVSEKDNVITLNKIIVPENSRGSGIGTAAMNDLVNYADANGKHIVLSPSADFGGNKKRLVQFYKKFGFVENKGKNRAFTTSESMHRTPNGKQALEQQNKGAFYPETLNINLFKTNNLSTVLHESGHFFLHVQFDMAAKLQALPVDELTLGEQELLADTQSVLDWFGVPDLATWYNMDFEQQRPFHERFATGFETYLYEGNAPSMELLKVFQRFASWLLGIYKKFKNRTEISPEMRGVFDRMLATRDQIALAQQARSQIPLFTREDAEAIGLTPEWFAEYQQLYHGESQAAVDDMQAKAMRDMAYSRNTHGKMFKKLQKEAEEKRRELRIEVRAKVMSQPVYRAWTFLTNKPQEGSETITGKLNFADLDSQIDSQGISSDQIELLKARKMVSKNGLHPQIVADLIGGFDSGMAMVDALIAAQDPKEVIEDQTDALMQQRYGELATPAAIAKSADAAIYNDIRARMLNHELNGLLEAVNPSVNTGAGNKRMLLSAAKQFAQDIIDGTMVKRLTPGMFATAAVKAGKASQAAHAKGETQVAIAEKRNQIINELATKATYNAQDDVAKILKYLKKFDKKIEGIDPDYLDQIEQILEGYDLKKRSNKELARRESLGKWVEKLKNDDIDPDIPQSVIDDLGRVSYKDLTVAEFRALADSIKTIEHMGRFKNKLLLASRIRDLEEARQAIIEAIYDNFKGNKPFNREASTPLESAKQWVEGFFVSHRKVAMIVRQMDGFKDGGIIWELLVKPANERANYEASKTAAINDALLEIMRPVSKAGGWYDKLPTKSLLGRDLTKQELFVAALNIGNEGNAQRLMSGENAASPVQWDFIKLTKAFNTYMTVTDWTAVQAIWDLFETLRPELAQKERNIYGREPEWVERKPFTINAKNDKGEVESLTLAGGYYPIHYDRLGSSIGENQDAIQLAEQSLKGLKGRPGTNRGHAKARAEKVESQPVSLSINGMYYSFGNVIHDLAWHEWLIDTKRLLNKRVEGAIKDNYGSHVWQQFPAWQRHIATQGVRLNDWLEKASNRLRRYVSMATMAYNVVTAAKQLSGIAQSFVRVGYPEMAEGIARFVGNEHDTMKAVNAKSEFMANRARTRLREINEVKNEIHAEFTTLQAIRSHSWIVMLKVQQMVDYPTWLGAYYKAIAETNGDESKSIAMADQAVIDSQGGGEVKDRAAIENSPLAAVFGTYYTFMNTQLQLNYDVLKSNKSAARKAADLLMLDLMPVIYGVAITSLLTAGGDDDDLGKKIAGEEISQLFGMIMIVREFSGIAQNLIGDDKDYQGPAAFKPLIDFSKLGMQVYQGEIDDAFRKALINSIGDVAGLPSTQLNRTWTGVQAMSEGKTDNPMAIGFGYRR